MGCFVRHNVSDEALLMFVRKRRCGVKPDEVTLVCLFRGCSRLGDLAVGLQGWWIFPGKFFPGMVEIKRIFPGMVDLEVTLIFPGMVEIKRIC